MTQFDVFNGDADGICALQQLRLAIPSADAKLVTGVKRDISLLKKVQAQAGDCITVLDISFDKNRNALLPLLELGAQVSYFDHHFAGEIPNHPLLEVHIDTRPDTCTSLIMNDHVENKHWLWAATGAFGDNFDQSALALIRSQNNSLSAEDIELIKNLGVFINYNAYGESVADLHISPEDLFRELNPYASPIDFIHSNSTYQRLESGYHEDMQKAQSLKPEFATDARAMFMLPAQPWARRVSGVYANLLAQNYPSRAHALLTHLNEVGYLVSVRAPLSTKEGADELCRQFDTGGGRKAAAGINLLPEAKLNDFISAFENIFPG
jgi:hypothetical protein